jgi:hypothetical protein
MAAPLSPRTRDRGPVRPGVRLGVSAVAGGLASGRFGEPRRRVTVDADSAIRAEAPPTSSGCSAFYQLLTTRHCPPRPTW